jgi:ABC-type multidrug transport system ATPase subunit
MPSEKIIEVTNLTKKFRKLIAVDNLHFNVYKGDVFGFLGPNGAGKSTTIRMLLSLIKPTKGSIKIFGKNLSKNRKMILKNVGTIVEKPDFYLFLTAYKNLEILGKLTEADVSYKNIMSKLELVGLKERYNSKVKTYSHGMKQRLGIAQALLHNPELIILDEPTTGLDPHGIKEIRDLIISLSSEQRKTILLSSHILKEIEVVATRMLIINKGKTIIEGSVQDLLFEDELKVSFGVKNCRSVEKLIQNSDWKKYFESADNNNILFRLNEDQIPILNKFLVSNNVDIIEIIRKRSLEDYFLKITSDSL